MHRTRGRLLARRPSRLAQRDAARRATGAQRPRAGDWSSVGRTQGSCVPRVATGWSSLVDSFSGSHVAEGIMWLSLCPAATCYSFNMATHKTAAEDDRQLNRQLASSILRSLIQDGTIDPTGKEPKQLIGEAIAYLRSRPTDVKFVADHTDHLLRVARRFLRGAEVELACLLFATWVEHKLNHFVAVLSVKRLRYADRDVMIRDSSYRAKMGWLLRLLGANRIPESHQSRIVKLMELRNSFVHYKWKASTEESEEELKRTLGEMSGTVRYLQYFERKHLGVLPRRLKRTLR